MRLEENNWPFWVSWLPEPWNLVSLCLVWHPKHCQGSSVTWSLMAEHLSWKTVTISIDIPSHSSRRVLGMLYYVLRLNRAGHLLGLSETWGSQLEIQGVESTIYCILDAKERCLIDQWMEHDAKKWSLESLECGTQWFGELSLPVPGGSGYSWVNMG